MTPNKTYLAFVNLVCFVAFVLADRGLVISVIAFVLRV